MLEDYLKLKKVPLKVNNTLHGNGQHTPGWKLALENSNIASFEDVSQHERLSRGMYVHKRVVLPSHMVGLESVFPNIILF